MIDKAKEIAEVLLELRKESFLHQYNSREIVDKYNMGFYGKKLNRILSTELCHTLTEQYKIDIINEELISMLPYICIEFHMHLEPMIELRDFDNSSPFTSGYFITLYQ